MGQGVDDLGQGTIGHGARHLSIRWTLVSSLSVDTGSALMDVRSMSDPGTTYRTRDEITQVRSEKDAIAGLKKYILDWGVTDEKNLKSIDKGAKEEVDKAVEEAQKSAHPDLKEFWTDIYVSPSGLSSEPSLIRALQYKGTEPPFMRGREKEEVHFYQQ